MCAHAPLRAAAVTAIVAFSLPGIVTLAQSPSDSSVDQRLERLENQVDQMRKELKTRDDKITGLESQLKSSTTAPSTAPDEIERTRQAVINDISRQEMNSSLTKRLAANFNPDLAVVMDMKGSYSPQRDNDAYNRFDVGEAELDLRMAVDPRADGVAVLTFARDFENPVFPEAGTNASGPDNSAGVEEAYLFFHDFGVPNLTAKVGRYHLRFGRQNILHGHDLPTVDPSLVNQAFLAPEALIDAGLSLSYVVPPKYVGDQYIELVGEIITGEGAGSESPTLRGDLSVDSPAFNGHMLWNTDLTDDINFELGGTYLVSHADADNSNFVNLFGIDATLIRRDPTGNFNNQLFQAEAIYGIVDDENGHDNHALGGYVLGQQQLDQDWYVGMRLDWTQNPNDEKQEAWGVSPYVSWYWSEFLRFRLEYQHRDGDVPESDAIWLQITGIFGAHPPHPYWAMK